VCGYSAQQQEQGQVETGDDGFRRLKTFAELWDYIVDYYCMIIVNINYFLFLLFLLL